MNGFLYFVPEQGTAASLVDKYGLRYAIERDPNIQPTRTGPDGKPGAIISDAQVVSRQENRFDQDTQSWRPQFGNTGVWIGYAGTPPPLPLLARSTQLPGRCVSLADGSSIIVPYARRWRDLDSTAGWTVALPRTLCRDEDGQWIRKGILGRYRRLWDLVVEYVDAREAAIQQADVEAGESVYFNFEPINELAVEGIAANYRVAADELEITGQFDESLVGDVLDVLTDQATFETWIKKKLPDLIADGGTFLPGPDPSTPAENPTTPLPSPTSKPSGSDSTDSE